MVIRIIFSIVILFLALLPSASQDIIQKYSGEKIEVLIVDISPGVIKYRKFDQQQGPVFSIAREQVEKIIYENGKITTFEQKEITEKSYKNEQDTNRAKPPPTFGWHIGFGASDLYGDILGSKIQLASAIGVSFTLPVGRNNTFFLEADVLSLGCGFEDMDIIFDDGTRLVITDANEDLGYLGLLIMDRFFFNANRNYFIEGGVYGSFLVNASTAGNAEITDTSGVVTSGAFEDDLLDLYKSYDFGLALGFGGRIPLDKKGKWHLTAGARFYYGLTNIADISFPGFEDYSESNIYGLIFVGVDIPTRSSQ